MVDRNLYRNYLIQLISHLHISFIHFDYLRFFIIQKHNSYICIVCEIEITIIIIKIIPKFIRLMMSQWFEILKKFQLKFDN